MSRRVHRALGLTLLAPILVWTATGLLFHVKPGWRAAYEVLDPFAEAPLDLAALRSPAELAAVAGASPANPPERLELRSTVLGPLARVRLADGSRALVSARSGALLSPLSAEDAARLARDAAARSEFAERFGDVLGTEEDDATVAVRFAGGAIVRVDRHDLSLSQRGGDTDWIDRLYRLHYLQWTGREPLDRALVLVAVGLTWVLALLGVRLAFGSRRRRAPGEQA